MQVLDVFTSQRCTLGKRIGMFYCQSNLTIRFKTKRQPRWQTKWNKQNIWRMYIWFDIQRNCRKNQENFFFWKKCFKEMDTSTHRETWLQRISLKAKLTVLCLLLSFLHLTAVVGVGWVRGRCVGGSCRGCRCDLHLHIGRVTPA